MTTKPKFFIYGLAPAAFPDSAGIFYNGKMYLVGFSNGIDHWATDRNLAQPYTWKSEAERDIKLLGYTEIDAVNLHIEEAMA